MTASHEQCPRVLLADPDPLVRRVVRDQLRQASFAVVADTSDGQEALQLARFHRPDLVVMEIELPIVDGISVIRQIVRDAPHTRVVVLSTEDDEDVAVRALRVGAVGYLSKAEDIELLPHVLRKVAEGEAVVPRALGMRVLESLRRMPDRGWRPLHSQLTTREWEIIELLSAGARTQDIADELVLSPATVYGHVKNILRKLEVDSRQAAVAAAQELRPTEVNVV